MGADAGELAGMQPFDIGVCERRSVIAGSFAGVFQVA